MRTVRAWGTTDDPLVPSASGTCWAVPWITLAMQMKPDPGLLEAERLPRTRGENPGTSQ